MWSYEEACAKMRIDFEPSAPGSDLTGNRSYCIETIALAIDKVR